MTTRANERPRLSAATVARANPAIERFTYDRDRLTTGIVHIGLGAFARAHLALYTEDCVARGDPAWGITGVNLRSADQRQRLLPQDFLYTAVSRGAAAAQTRIVGVLQSALSADTMDQILAALVAPTTHIVSLTVTEKGYAHDPATGRINAAHPDIRHDLATPATPRSAVGLLVAALAARRAAGHAPFTVLCCDNLPHNGRLVANLVRDFAALSDDRLAAWIEANVAFPSTMVDRIVPATTDADIAAVAASTGLYDAAPVVHEPFTQWVVEDTFVDRRRPRWQEVGVELVGDVAPYEAMKLRMLNASHSALAYLGYLADRETIAECAADPVLADYVKRLWSDEIIPVLTPPAGVDLARYADALMTRYANPAIRHRTWQIAMDGSQKLPQRLLVTVRDRLERNLPVTRLAYAVGAWMIYVSGVDLKGNPIDVRDPLAAQLQRVSAEGRRGGGVASEVESMLAQATIFGHDLPRSPVFRAALIEAVTRLRDRGVPAALAAV